MNIFGSSKECGILLVPKERSSSISPILRRLNLPLISTIDDVALLLLHKPQYPYEVLAHSASAPTLGTKYPSPALGALVSEYEVKTRGSDAEILELRGRPGSLPESLARSYAAKLADQETRSERKLEEMTTQVEALTRTTHSLQQEILLQKASFL